MAIWLLSPVLLAAAALLVRPVLRRALGAGSALSAPAPMPVPPAEAPVAASTVPPATATESTTAAPLEPALRLEPAAILARLRLLQLGLPAPYPPPSTGYAPFATAVLAALGDAAAARRHFPRRPNLLPQLMHAINDEGAARRQLVAIIARDPALVDSLLRMANSSFYRISNQPIESIDRAVAILGSDGLRSVITTALLQPIFTAQAAQDFPRFAPLVWEHALRSAQASLVHAAVAERIEPFAAELLSLITGMAEIVLFRAARAQWTAERRGTTEAAAWIATLLHAHAGTLAQRIAADWQLSESAHTALAEQNAAQPPSTPLGRSLRFGRLAGALAVLHENGLVDAATVRLNLPDSTLPAAHTEVLTAKLLQPLHDPRTGAARSARPRDPVLRPVDKRAEGSG